MDTNIARQSLPVTPQLNNANRLVISTRQAMLIRLSCTKMLLTTPIAVRRFIRRLCEIEPDFQAAFHHDVQKKLDSLALQLEEIVDLLDSPAGLQRKLILIGVSCAGKNIHDLHYAAVGNALLHALETTLQNDFRSEVRDAWLSAYGLVIDVMQDVADNTPKPKPVLTSRPHSLQQPA